MTGHETAIIIISAVQAFASLGAVAAILAGIRQMRNAGDQRAAREDARHAEAMESIREGFRQQAEAIRVVIERTGGRA